MWTTFTNKKISLKQAKFYIITLFILFFLFRILSLPPFLTDSYEYLETATLIRNFEYFNNPNIDHTLLTKRPFVYPLFLAFLVHKNPFVIISIQTLISIISFFILLKVIKNLNIKINNFFVFFLILTPSIYIYTQLLMTEWLVMFWLHLILYLIFKDWSQKNFLYIQLITCLLAFTKPVFYPLIYINSIFFIFFFIQKKTFSIWFFLPILTLQLYLNYNENKTGFRHFSSIENINLINYNLYYFKASQNGKEKADLWKEMIYDNPKTKQKSFKETSIYLRNIGKKEIQDNLLSYSWYHLKNSIRGLFDPGRFDIMSFFKKENGSEGLLEVLNGNKSFSYLLNTTYIYIYLLLIPIFIFNFFKWWYFIKFFIKNKLPLLNYYILILLISYIALTGPINCSRFMMPFQGIVLFFCIWQISKQTVEKYH